MTDSDNASASADAGAGAGATTGSDAPTPAPEADTAPATSAAAKATAAAAAVTPPPTAIISDLDDSSDGEAEMSFTSLNSAGEVTAAVPAPVPVRAPVPPRIERPPARPPNTPRTPAESAVLSVLDGLSDMAELVSCTDLWAQPRRAASSARTAARLSGLSRRSDVHMLSDALAYAPYAPTEDERLSQEELTGEDAPKGPGAPKVDGTDKQGRAEDGHGLVCSEDLTPLRLEVSAVASVLGLRVAQRRTRQAVQAAGSKTLVQSEGSNSSSSGGEVLEGEGCLPFSTCVQQQRRSNSDGETASTVSGCAVV